MEENALQITQPEAPKVQAPAAAESQVETAGQEQSEPPPERPEDRLKKLENGLSRKRQQLADARAQADHWRRQAEEFSARLTPRAIGVDNRGDSGDSDIVTLKKDEAHRLIEEKARKMAPTIAKQQAEQERLWSARESLRESLGDVEFNELTSDLAELLPAPRQLDVLKAKDVTALVRYLTADEHAAEAKAIGAMSHFEAGMALARLEDRLSAEAAKAKPQASKVPAPIEVLKGAPPVSKELKNLDYDQFVERRREQIRSRR